MSREQIVRDTAYAIWEAEGKPEGRDSDHWRQAEARVAGSLTSEKQPAPGGFEAARTKSDSAPAKSGAKAKPSAVKPSATKTSTKPAGGAKPGSNPGR